MPWAFSRRANSAIIPIYNCNNFTVILSEQVHEQIPILGYTNINLESISRRYRHELLRLYILKTTKYIEMKKLPYL